MAFMYKEIYDVHTRCKKKCLMDGVLSSFPPKMDICRAIVFGYFARNLCQVKFSASGQWTETDFLFSFFFAFHLSIMLSAGSHCNRLEGTNYIYRLFWVFSFSRQNRRFVPSISVNCV